MANQYRYSSNSFNRSVVTAVGLTLIVTFLIWLFARLMALPQANTITIISGLVFFAFCSAAMIWRYMRNDVVFAIRPDGLFDARYSSQAIPWDEIKDVRLERAENEFQLGVYLWPRQQTGKSSGPTFTVDLSVLDGTVEQILRALAEHKQIYFQEKN
ncbi:MAG: hypothetical protein ABJM29_01380 [Rhizobiaceae bacterium]